MKLDIQITKATMTDYPVIQNMARFYAYDLSRHCGFLSEDWAMPEDGLYTCFDLKPYFEEDSRGVYLVRVNQELAGFVLLNQIVFDKHSDWNMGEFFILAKFQGKGVGSYVAQAIWDQYPGIWEVPVIPENHTALAFWHRFISEYTQDHYQFATKLARPGQNQPYRAIFTFDNLFKKQLSTTASLTEETITIQPAAMSDLSQWVKLSYTKRREWFNFLEKYTTVLCCPRATITKDVFNRNASGRPLH